MQGPRRKRVYIAPNLITAASLFSGMMAIMAASDGRFIPACYLILLSAVLDALDGPVARITRTASPFGVQFDSLADVVAFGVAPAFLMLRKLGGIEAEVDLPAWAPRMAMGVCGLYAVCGAIRLARFNTQVHAEEKTGFTGLPIPGAAGTVVSTFMVVEEYLDASRNLHRSILILMILMAYLMVSTIPFPSLKGLARRHKRSLDNFVTIIFGIFIVVAFRQHLPIVCFVLFMGYVLFSLTTAIASRRRMAAQAAGVAPPPGPARQ